MDELFTLADDLGPDKIIHIHKPAVGLQAILVVDNVAAGPSIGGLRMAPDVSTEVSPFSTPGMYSFGTLPPITLFSNS